MKFTTREFIVLMALLTSIMALAIDSMLPAFPDIQADFDIENPAQLQLIVAYLFLGFGIGQLIFGPLSDIIGRKTPIYFGVAIFLVGTLICWFAPTFNVLLLGRTLQGFGGAGPRIVSIAIIRDKFSGNRMAKITSLVMTIFVLVPALAPFMGQLLLNLYDWRAIFTMLFCFSLFMWLWFAIRQNETLPPERRLRLSTQHVLFGVKETFRQPTTVIAMIATGFLFGIFVGYLGSIQSIFEHTFGKREEFPIYFGILALSIGTAAFFNSTLVMALGMRKLIFIAFLSMALVSNLFAIYISFLPEQEPSLLAFMVYMMVNFISVGFLFGNLNALGMDPIGHVAGIGSALLGSAQILLASFLGAFVGPLFHNNIQALVISFGAIAIICLALMGFESRFAKRTFR